jgi:exodeoxyribonuclease VII large subunit
MIRMSDLFSTPFEEDPQDEAHRRQPGAADPRSAAVPERRVLTVTELTAAIRGLLESSFGDVWVEGEISNCRVWNTGHMYFTLKDGSAQIKAVMFRSAMRYLRFKAEDGLHVTARGRLGVYEPKGEYQLVCEHIEPRGLGALQLAFDQLKRQLQQEGLFDRDRKRRLPALPRTIGIVTSLEGAAIRDIIKVIGRRHPNAHLVIRPARVQGEGAAADLTRALRAIAKVPGVDVVVIGRGGGSAEDLRAFNDEGLARAIAACPVPVVSAIGHEVDFTIADFVADLRAPTPSAAAEMVIAAQEECCARIDRLTDRLRTAARAALERRRATTQALVSRRGLAGWQTRLAMKGRHTAELTHDLRTAGSLLVARLARAQRALRSRLDARDVRRGVATVRSRLAAADSRLATSAVRLRDRADARLTALAGRLESLSPLAVLARGYAVCWNADRTRIIREASSVAVGDDVRMTLYRGELRCEVKGNDNDNDEVLGF